MRKIFGLVLGLLMFFNGMLFSQHIDILQGEEAGENKEFHIAYMDESYLIILDTGYFNSVSIALESEHMEYFEQVFNKFDEWCIVADENNIKDFRRILPFTLDIRVGIIQMADSYFQAKTPINLDFYFLVGTDGKKFLRLVTNEMEAIDSSFVKDELDMIFTNDHINKLREPFSIEGMRKSEEKISIEKDKENLFN